MKIPTGMLSNFFKTLRIIYQIQQDNISYRELIEFFYRETPPEDHNFLKYDYSPFIDSVIKLGSYKKNAVLFSIIIPTYNRRESLLKTLNSVISQNNISPAEFEVVIIDNGSKDETEEVVKHFAEQNGRMNIVYIKLLKNCGGDFARNVGVLHSRGRLLVFTDDDCIVPTDWLFEFKRELEADPNLDGVGGFKIPKSTKERLDVYHRFLMWGHFLQPHKRTKNLSLLDNKCGGLNANVCYRKDIFEKIGGFNVYFKHMGAKDLQIRLHKSGVSLLYEPRMVEHFAYFNFKAHILKLFPQSFDRYLLHKLYPNVWPDPSFLYFLKRTIGDIKLIFSYPAAQERSRYLMRSDGKIKISDMVRFSFVSIVTNFFLWFGKYWLAGK